jgi:glycosyltransferase involved in cell wall biosynthesis
MNKASDDEDGDGPRVAVLMAVFNGEDYVGQALSSILTQSFADFEFIVVDDGSTDRTAEIIRSYDDPRIRLLTNAQNLGLARSLNRGLSEARGEFVARQDADDISEPDRLRRQIEFLDANPTVALAGTWYTEIDRDGQPRRRRALPSSDMDIRWSLLFFCPFVHSSVMWRRLPVSTQVGTYDEALRYSMDFDLWTRVARRFPIANLEEHLVRMRLHPGSMSMTFGDSAREGHRDRVAAVAAKLRWSERGREPEEFERLFLAIDALARGVDNGSTFEDALAALDDLFMLFEVFAEEIGLEGAERRDRRAALRSKAARILLRLARRDSSGHVGFRISMQLLAAAARVWSRPPVPVGREGSHHAGM